MTNSLIRNLCNLKIFLQAKIFLRIERDVHLNIKSVELLTDLFLRLIGNRYQILCHHQADFDILLGKLTAQIGGCI